jgi:protein-S-isoprenylcysteine O-methyltransferase Ste14
MKQTYFSSESRILLSRVLALAVLAALVVCVEGWRVAAPIVEDLLSLAGWVFLGIGMSGRIWSSSYISGRKKTELVVEGPYSICRHPLYFFSFVAGLGVMLVTETLLLPLLFSIVFWVYYPHVMRREEEVLLRLHHAVFEAYCSRVPRFWPKFSLYVEPPNYTVSAAKFRRNLSDVVWFVVAGGVIEFVEAMHISRYLPTLLTLY